MILYGFHVGKYTSPMDGMGPKISDCSADESIDPNYHPLQVLRKKKRRETFLTSSQRLEFGVFLQTIQKGNVR